MSSELFLYSFSEHLIILARSTFLISIPQLKHRRNVQASKQLLKRASERANKCKTFYFPEKRFSSKMVTASASYLGTGPTAQFHSLRKPLYFRNTDREAPSEVSSARITISHRRGKYTSIPRMQSCADSCDKFDDSASCNSSIEIRQSLAAKLIRRPTPHLILKPLGHETGNDARRRLRADGINRRVRNRISLARTHGLN